MSNIKIGDRELRDDQPLPTTLVKACNSVQEFEQICNEASALGYVLNSWQHLYHNSCGYGITAVFLKA